MIQIVDSVIAPQRRHYASAGECVLKRINGLQADPDDVPAKHEAHLLIRKVWMVCQEMQQERQHEMRLIMNRCGAAC